MIPLSLSLSGFLSYRDTVEIDFSPINLACIAGQNGAGKSSLLDAITWALFGQARKTGEALINTASPAAEVSFTFAYEGNTYKVQRTLPRGKTTILEFHILQTSEQLPVNSDPVNVERGTRNVERTWKPLTERTGRETQSRIEQTLRLDYDTFVNASFFLQGKADQFTQQTTGKRKQILASILGLEIWENYRLRTADRRKTSENDIAEVDGRLAEIAAELAEEETRKTRLKELENDLSHATQARQVQEKSLENIRKMTAALAEQSKLVDALARQVEAAMRRLADLQVRADLRQEERKSLAEIVSRAPQIQSAYQTWQTTRSDLEKWEAVAAQFHEHEKRRQPFLDELNVARAKLLQEQETLQTQQTQIEAANVEGSTLNVQLANVQRSLEQAEATLSQRLELEAQFNEARTRQAEAKAENPRLKAEMDELKARIDQLSVAEGADCPLCGQPLSPDDRQRLVEELSTRGKDMGDRYRTNQSLLRDADQQIANFEIRISNLAQAEQERLTHTQALAALSTRLTQIQQTVTDWEKNGEPRLTKITLNVERETFNVKTRTRLKKLDAELKAIGYDAAAHDEARRRELEGRPTEEEMRNLEKAQAALTPVEREIAELDIQRSAFNVELEKQRTEHEVASIALVAAQENTPDLHAAERDLLTVQEQENRLRMEVGAAQQKVLVLDDLKARRKTLGTHREELARLIGQYKQLERAFGKDGVPALLIEQALPQIESKANEILDRLSGGNMTVRFATQAEFKNKKRDDLKETLDILISDSAGTRDYEMFSGGEAFRVNFAIRLALSEVLAQRAGARLQTLVIDEGFGSQDAQGRQRLVEAINLVKPDFAKILVITHIDELKDAFPTRIDVEKTERGSTIRVI